jgi:ADP-ribose pyrophosphatase
VEEMHKFEEKTIHTEKLFEGKVVRLQIDDVELPNGKTSKREIIKHPGAVAVLALTPENKIVLVEQYRKPMERALVEIPAGKLEPGEKPEVTAVRELEEETGYECNRLDHIISFYTSPGFADELIHLYLATGLRKKENPRAADEDEFVELIEVSLEEAIQLVKEQKIFDAKTAYAIQYLQLKEAQK